MSDLDPVTRLNAALEGRFASAEGFADSNVSQQFDPSPDDQRLLAIRISTAGTQVRDVIIQNFFEELREVVPE